MGLGNLTGQQVMDDAYLKDHYLSLLLNGDNLRKTGFVNNNRLESMGPQLLVLVFMALLGTALPHTR